jgi:guanine deaminase
METISARQSGVAHCPLSNVYFSDAVFPLRAAMEKGLHVGLGTDISGGPSGSMFDGMRSAVMVSRMLENGIDAGVARTKRRAKRAVRIDFRDAFYLATTGGGVALNLPVGHFSTGYQFDAMVVDTTAKHGTIRLWDDLDGEGDVLQKIVYTASKPNITRVWIGGRQVA